SSKYAMVERFQYEESKKYPGKASVIFWTNGPELRLNNDGTASLTKDSDARGIMYVTAANDVYALDARTGRALWHYQRPVSSGLLDDAAAHKNRGVAVWKVSSTQKPTTPTCFV